jgi:hypothetical protein
LVDFVLEFNAMQQGGKVVTEASQGILVIHINLIQKKIQNTEKKVD